MSWGGASGAPPADSVAFSGFDKSAQPALPACKLQREPFMLPEAVDAAVPMRSMHKMTPMETLCQLALPIEWERVS